MTGVQTCALPISDGLSRRGLAPEDSADEDPEELEASMDADHAPVELENEDNEDSEDSEDNFFFFFFFIVT